jgi:hypothetical protein
VCASKHGEVEFVFGRRSEGRGLVTLDRERVEIIVCNKTFDGGVVLGRGSDGCVVTAGVLVMVGLIVLGGWESCRCWPVVLIQCVYFGTRGFAWEV